MTNNPNFYNIVTNTWNYNPIFILSHQHSEKFIYLFSILDTISETDPDEMYEEIEELENLVGLLQEPNQEIKREFSKVRIRKPEKLQLLLKSIVRFKQLKFLRYMIAIESLWTAFIQLLSNKKAFLLSSSFKNCVFYILKGQKEAKRSIYDLIKYRIFI